MVPAAGPWDHRCIIDLPPPIPEDKRAGRRRHAWWRAQRVAGPLRRSTADRMVGGVAGGIAGRLGLDATLVRVLFVLLTIGGGTGLAVYVLAWLLVPRQGDRSAILTRALADRRTVALGLAIAIALLAMLLVLVALGANFVSGLVWPVTLAAGGLVLVWRGAEDEEKAFLRDLLLQTPLGASGERPRLAATLVRVVVGAALVLAGLGGLVASRRPTTSVLIAFTAAAVVIAGFVVVFGPWWIRLARDLAEEHRQRVRVQERADVASAVHDSVLQTLALIQRAAGDQREVTRLARAQERDLRAWLFEGRPPGSFDAQEVTTVVEAIEVIERQVEAAHGVAVETVAVGDCPLDDDIEALLAAGREAAVNAAKWSGQDSVALFVEVEAARVSLFVRDRGRGFDPASVAGDRQGIAQSIVARVKRHGGSVAIRSAPDKGTEVELVMPRGDNYR